MPEHLFLVEDDHKLASLLTELLEGHGWQVSHYATGEEALEHISDKRPDLVLLDIMLPGIDGIEVCKRMRQMVDTKILMLTALGSDADQILGLEVGADDYLVKTAPTRLLLARIRALLRRGNIVDQLTTKIDLGWCQIETAQQRLWLTSLGGQEVRLSSAEFEVLALLADQAGQIVSREHLFQALFNRPYDSTDRTLDRRIVRLRRSLCDNDGLLIRTVRGAGYLAVRETNTTEDTAC